MKGYIYRHLQQESVRGGIWVGLGLIILRAWVGRG